MIDRSVASFRLVCVLIGFPAWGCGHLGIELDGEGASLTDQDVGIGASGGEFVSVSVSDGAGGGNGGVPVATGGAASGGGDTGGSSGEPTGGAPAGSGAVSGAGSGGDSGGSSGSGGDSGGSGGAVVSGGGSGGAVTSGGAGGSGGNIDSKTQAGTSAGDCLGNSDVDFSLVGWAAEAGGTIGGRNGRTVQAATGAQIVAALSNRTTLQPLTILVTGTITPLNTGADKIDIKDMRDVSIIGVGGGGEFDGIGIKLWRTGNVVLRNLEIHHVDIGEMDAVSIAGPTDHVWVDHCEFYSEFQGAPKGTYDGLVDIKDDAEYITLSWNYLHDSWGTSIVGATEDDTFDRKLTMHHNWLSNVNTGAPSVRGGTAHVFSNYYEDIETIGVNSRIGACVRLENNFFIGVTDPWVSAYSSVVGDAELVCDSYEKSLFTEGLADVFELGTCSLDVPYDYSTVLTHVDSVAGVVQGNAGVGKLTDPRLF